MPKNLKKVQIYPNPVITLLEVSISALHNLRYIVLALCKAARPAPKKERIEILVLEQGSSCPISLAASIEMIKGFVIVDNIVAPKKMLSYLSSLHIMH